MDTVSKCKMVTAKKIYQEGVISTFETELKVNFSIIEAFTRGTIFDGWIPWVKFEVWKFEGKWPIGV